MNAQKDVSVETDAKKIDVESPTTSCSAIDVLFIIDNSDSMSQEQDNLIANFPRFADAVKAHHAADGSIIDYRFAVTKTGGIKRSFHPDDAGKVAFFAPDGSLYRPYECIGDDAWVEANDANIAKAFSCRANVGTFGSIFEMPLRAIEEAINNEDDQSFFRENAMLAIVILTDEDDCSRSEDKLLFDSGKVDRETTCLPENLNSLSQTIDALDDFKGARANWTISILAGDEEGGCKTELGTALEAKRLKEFATMAGVNTQVGSICSGDLQKPLLDALESFSLTCKDFVLL